MCDHVLWGTFVSGPFLRVPTAKMGHSHETRSHTADPLDAAAVRGGPCGRQIPGNPADVSHASALNHVRCLANHLVRGFRSISWVLLRLRMLGSAHRVQVTLDPGLRDLWGVLANLVQPVQEDAHELGAAAGGVPGGTGYVLLD